jgi:hypothetical protein
MKPILFSTPMVRAILSGHKTMTRRVMKPTVNGGTPVPLSHCALGAFDINKNGECFNFYDTNGYYSGAAKQHIFPSDILWVRETWGKYGKNGQLFFRADYPDGARTYECEWPVPDEHDDKIVCDLPKWRPSIHMPQKFARVFLRVTDVRVDRLQGITVEDVMSEGLPCDNELNNPDPSTHTGIKSWNLEYARFLFRDLWDKLNAARGYGWEKNPWVWVYTFERITREEAMEAAT